MPGRAQTTRRVALVLIAIIVVGLGYIVVTQSFSTSGRIGVSMAGLFAIVALLAVAEPESTVGRVLLVYQRFADAISEALGWLSKWLVPTCVAVGFANVLLRYIGRFQQRSLTSNRYIELQWMLFGAIFLLAFPYVLKHGINVRVDFLFQNYSRKRKALVDFVGHLIGLVPYCLFAIWATWETAMTSLFQKGDRWETWRVWELWEQSPDARGLPRAPIKVLLLLGFVFLAVQTMAELIKLGFVLGERSEIEVEPEVPDHPLRVE